MNYIKNLWGKLSQSTRDKVISAGHTFVSTFVTVIVMTIGTGGIQWTWAFWGSVLAVALRQAWKSIYAYLAPVSLGGFR